MKRVLVVAAVAVFLGCGGSSEPIAETSPPALPTAEKGRAAAPDGASIAYTVIGSGSPTLVFVHGWMCNQSFWSEQVDEFAASHKVVTLDLPGHGASGRVREGWPLMAFGGDVKAVVEHLGLKDVILVGHSMGGPVALEAARLMPDRVIGVIGVDSLQDAEFKYEPGQAEAFVSAFTEDFVGACDRFVVGMFAKDPDPALVERIRSEMCSGTPEIGVALMEQYSEYDALAAFQAVAVPIRCINAGLWPTNFEGNRRAHEDFDAVIIEGPGHFLMMETPEEFNLHLRQVLEEISPPE